MEERGKRGKVRKDKCGCKNGQVEGAKVMAERESDYLGLFEERNGSVQKYLAHSVRVLNRWHIGRLWLKL